MPSEKETLFICQCCGQCCRGYGGTYLEVADIHAIAAYLGCRSGEFIERFCQISCGRPVLGQGSNGYCIFFDGRCSIHPVKPRMCRRWPFIPAVLRDVANWHAMATACPGMRTDFPDAVILRQVAVALENEGGAGRQDRLIGQASREPAAGEIQVR